MSTVLERVLRLIALSGSPNENEGRNAAVLAARLIREHKLLIVAPASPRTGRTPPGGTARRRTPGSKRNVRRVADPAERIKAPLGGDCTRCRGRFRAGQEIYWFASGGGMHPACFEEWARTL
jgi:hypothetical protein